MENLTEKHNKWDEIASDSPPCMSRILEVVKYEWKMQHNQFAERSTSSLVVSINLC
jgi:hypothetical protein